MSDSQKKPKWVLYSPAAPNGVEPLPPGESVKPQDAEYASSSEHEEGFFLPGAEFDGWRFGLLQEHLHASGLLAFVRSPLGLEATLVSDPHAHGIERLSASAQAPKYLGAFRIQLPLPLNSLENVISGFRAALPLIKQQFKDTSSPHA